MVTKSIAVLLSVMVVMAAVVVPTEARIKGRKNCMTKAGSRIACNSSVSFFKRLLDETYRQMGSDEGLETQRDGDLEVKMLLLRELLLDEKYRNIYTNLGETEDEANLERRGDTRNEQEVNVRLLRELLNELKTTDAL